MLNHTVDVLSDISSYLSILQSYSMYYFNVGGDSGDEASCRPSMEFWDLHWDVIALGGPSAISVKCFWSDSYLQVYATNTYDLVQIGRGWGSCLCRWLAVSTCGGRHGTNPNSRKLPPAVYCRSTGRVQRSWAWSTGDRKQTCAGGGCSGGWSAQMLPWSC